MLQTAGRTDIPIGTGVAIGDMKTGHRQDGWVKDFDLSKYPGKIYPDGVQAMIDTIMNSPEPITIISIGPLPNVAAALEREPNIAKKARFVGMQGSIRRGYGEKSKPQKEYNVVSFIKASKTVFTADWDMTITPLDTCAMVSLDGDDYKKVLDCNSPITNAVIENYRVWAKSGNMNEAQAGSRSSTLFDTVAIYLAMSHDLLEMENLGIRVTDDGCTVIDDKAKKINCAMKWKNLDAFEDFLVERLTSPAIPAPASRHRRATDSHSGRCKQQVINRIRIDALCPMWYSAFEQNYTGKRLMITGISKLVTFLVILALCEVAMGEPNNVILPPIVEPNRFLTLKDYTSYAEAHNAGLKSRYQQWVTATEEVVQAKTLPDPQLTYGDYMPISDTPENRWSA